MDDEKRNSSKACKMKERIKTIIIIVLIIIIIILLLRGCEGVSHNGTDDGNNNTTQIIVDDKETLHDTTDGNIRIKINPNIKIKNGMMEDLNFCNYNEDRILKLKIMVDNQSAYESGEIGAGEILKSDYLNTNVLKEGSNNAIAQVYSYSEARELLSQTNVAVSLEMIS